MLKPNDVISGVFGSYQIKALKGEGTYARVAWCVDLSNNQNVAVKISRLRLSRATKHEAFILKELACLSNNVVKFIKAFKYQDHYCLVLEHLDQSLFDFIYKRQFKPLHISNIRHITKQLLVTFKELAKRGIVHADLKPDNIMLVNQKCEPFRIKLIDFGLSKRVSCMPPGISIQAIRYRAPEVILGTKLSEAVDMWSLGCVLAFLFQGKDLFPYESEYESLRIITQMLGMPDQHFLTEGRFTEKFFSCDSEKTETDQYKLRPREEYKVITGKRTQPSRNLSESCKRLEDMMANRPQPKTEEEWNDTMQFFDLLKKLLQVNPAERISVAKALQHPFITQKMPSTSFMHYFRAITGGNHVKTTDNSDKISNATIMNGMPNIAKGTDSDSRKKSEKHTTTSRINNTESGAKTSKDTRTTICQMSKDTSSANNQSITWSCTPFDNRDTLSSSSSDLSLIEPKCLQAFTSTAKRRIVKERVPTASGINVKATKNSGKTSNATIMNGMPNLAKGTDSDSRKTSEKHTQTSRITNTESGAKTPKDTRTTSCQMSKDTSSANNQSTNMAKAKGKLVVGRIGHFFRKMFRNLTCTNVSGVDE